MGSEAQDHSLLTEMLLTQGHLKGSNEPRPPDTHQQRYGTLACYLVAGRMRPGLQSYL